MMPSILCIEIPTYRLCGFVGYFARSQIYALSSEPYALYSDSLLHKRTAQRRQLFHPFRYPCFSAQKTGDSQPLDVKTGDTQPKLSAACFVVQSCLADADFVVFSNYCLIGTRLSLSFFIGGDYCFTEGFSFSAMTHRRMVSTMSGRV